MEDLIPTETMQNESISDLNQDQAPEIEDIYSDEDLHAALASSLWERYQNSGDEQLLAMTIAVERALLQMRTPGHAKRAESCGNLALSFTEQFSKFGGDDVIREAVDLEREALALRPRGHPHRAMSCGNLANALNRLYSHVGDIAYIAEAIDMGREAISLLPSDDPARVMHCGNLATSLFTLFRQNADQSLLDEAIAYERETLSWRSLGHADRYISCSNLAQSLMMKYHICDGNTIFITEAMSLHREALALSPKDHHTRATACLNLATILETRYDHIGGDDLLNEAVELKREALSIIAVEHPERAMYCAHLATSLERLYDRTGSDQFHTEALQLHRDALVLRPPGHPNHASTCSNFAMALSSLYSNTGDFQILGKILELQRRAVTSHPPGHPNRIPLCRNLAETLMEYNHHVHNSDDLDEALALLLEVSQLAPPHQLWSHQCSLSKLYLESTSSFYDVSKAITHLYQSLDHQVDNPASAVRAILSCLDRLWQVITVDDSNYHLSLSVVYKRLVPLLPLLINPALGIQTQLQVLIGRSRAGYDAFVNAVLADHKNYPMGLELLEIAVCVFWSQTLFRRDPQLDQVPKQLATKLERILLALSSQPKSGGEGWLTAQDALYNTSARLYSLLEEIRVIPGLNRFMLGESYEALSSLASVSHPVVVLVGARNQFFALIITSRQPEMKTLIRLEVSQERLEQYLQLRGSQESHRGLRLTKSSPPLNRHLEYLWHNIVYPVLHELRIEACAGAARSKSRLHWCPTGIFSSLPLHAAGMYDGKMDQRVCCADYVVSSYIPTLTSLLRLRKTATPHARATLNLMLVAEARAYDPALQTIPGVVEEFSCVSAVAKTSRVQVSHHKSGLTTIVETAAAMERADLVHLACHGVQDISDATQSGFCLGDGRLTIASIMELQSRKRFLAFLSACETATGSREQPDQALHAAAAMMVAGFKNVIASMWAINDADGPDMAKWFYEEVFKHDIIDADVVARALDSAVSKLRDSGVPIERWAPFIHMGA